MHDIAGFGHILRFTSGSGGAGAGDRLAFGVYRLGISSGRDHDRRLLPDVAALRFGPPFLIAKIASRSTIKLSNHDPTLSIEEVKTSVVILFNLLET
ncbi:MAG: hypothetical protein J0I98_14820 [Mesorhizobium sp.]|nr:hypothetical protein [Mesorhizobium sp.]MBN9244062.1 hypothetical protein [Mesorhizobium sp.]